MANEFLTMLDIAKVNGSDPVVGVIEENLKSAPEARLFPARTIMGTSFKTVIRTALPSVGFRSLNEGVATTKSKYANKLVECFYLDAQMEMDVAIARADELGEEHALALEADGHGLAALQTIGTQTWYGTGDGGDSKGYPGAVQVVDSSLVVDAGGTTASTGSSVYGVIFGEKYSTLIFGKGSVFTMPGWRQQTVTRSSKEMTAWKNSLEGFIGAQWVNVNGLGRIKKLTADSGKTLTDDLLYALESKLPAGLRFDAYFMSRRSLEQLRKSRTATNPTGVPAPTPSVSGSGIAIHVTDSIIDTEALTL
jgi:hypothetical protein